MPQGRGFATALRCNDAEASRTSAIYTRRANHLSREFLPLGIASESAELALWLQNCFNGQQQRTLTVLLSLHLAGLTECSNCALQSNHRSWADFYLDVVATDGNAQMLSRMAVAWVFPMFMGAVCIIRSVILFQRGRKHDKEASDQSPLLLAQQNFKMYTRKALVLMQ